MSESFVAEAHGATAGAVSLTIPSVQGQDAMFIVASAATTGILTPAGWAVVRTDTPVAGSTCVLLKKTAAGAAGSASTDVGATVSVAPVNSGIHTSAALFAWRGVDPTNPVNDVDFQPYSPITGGTTSFTGTTVTTTVDGCDIVSAFMDKNSVTINFTQPSGYTLRSSAVASSGTGRTDTLVASKAGGSHGNYGADAWTTDATPGAVGIYTLALTPVSTTQTIRPTSDVSTSGTATGVPDAANLYNNINENGSPDPSSYVELTASSNFEVQLATLTDPGVDTGFTVDYTVAFGASTAGAVWAVTLYQNTTSIETWNHTQSADNDTQSHALSSANVANISFTGSPAQASNLRLKFSLTSVS